MTWCVYAVTSRGATPARIRGLAGEPLRQVRHAAVAAAVGELRRPPSPTRTNLIRYDATIRALAERTPAILPARFGTCVGDLDELRAILQSRGRSLQRSLAEVRNRVQMTVRIVGAGGASGVGPRPAVARRASPGRSYLEARAAAAAHEREIPGFEPLREAVRRWIRDERVEKLNEVASVYHLVPRGSVGPYRKALERAAAAADLKIVISGPFPPYAFAAI